MCKFTKLLGALGVVPGAALLLAACEPAACAGMDVCATPTAVSYQGDVILKHTKVPAESIQVNFVRTSGARLLPSDSVTVFTDSLGQFRITGQATSGQDVVGTLTIFPPRPVPPIRYEEVRLAPALTSAETRYLGTWRVDHPHFGQFGTLVFRNTGAFAENVEVEFRRRDGLRVTPGSLRVKTDAAGRFSLEPTPVDTGTVVFDLVVRPPAPYRPTTIENLKMTARTSPPAERQLGVWRIGPHLPYLGLLIWGDNKQGAVGVKVKFKRVSGIPIQPDSFVVETNQWANFWLAPAPLGYGSVTGELTVTPPAPYKTFTRLVTLTTTEEETQNVLAGTWEIPRQ